MNILLIILVVTFLLILGAGLAFLQIFRPKKDENAVQTAASPKTKVRWNFFAIPLIILILSVIITIAYYGKLPDPVYLRPDTDSTASITRFMAVLWAIVPQLLMALIAMIIAYGAGKITALFAQTPDAGAKQLEGVMLVMSNMVIIPQLVLLVAMINIFSYNAFKTHMSFVWWFSLTVVFTGIIVLTIFFVRALQKMAKANK